MTLETIAACYVDRLKRVQPVGPYHLGGFCAATLLALEMACQLEARGDEVGVLVGIDGNVLGDTDAALQPASRTLALLRNLPRWFIEDARRSGAADLVGRMRSWWHRVQTRGRRATGGGAPAPVTDIRDTLGMWRFPDHQRPMLEVHHGAVRAYQPKAFHGTALLLLPRTAPLLGPWPRGYDRQWIDSRSAGLPRSMCLVRIRRCWVNPLRRTCRCRSIGRLTAWRAPVATSRTAPRRRSGSGSVDPFQFAGVAMPQAVGAAEVLRSSAAPTLVVAPAYLVPPA